MAETNDQFEIVEEQDEYGNDVTDWKALALKSHGLAKRYHSKYQKYKGLAKELEKTKPEEKEPEKLQKTGLDYGQKAFLVANGIKGEAEMQLVMDYLASGKELDKIIESKHFQNDLNDLREDKAAKDATPSGTKRTGGQGRDSIEYWLAKGELPPPDQVELRQKVVNAKLQRERAANQFTSRPVIR